MGKSETDINLDTDTVHYQLLGHDRGVYYYLPAASGQVVALRSNQHVEGHLIELAPLTHWETNYGSKQGVNWRAAQDDLIRKQQAFGIYDQSRIRGRGAWWDSEKPVLHLGDRLIVDGEDSRLTGGGRYIYESAIPLRIENENPLPKSEASKLAEICNLIAWERPIYSKYLAGWLAIAPICGALRWRPHVWITASPSAGKSWIFSEIISKLLGSIAIRTQHDSTEASLRQSINSDARPVIFDEAEAQSDRGRMRMDSVLELARAASTDDSPPIRKGSPGGTVSLWYVRSSFLFSSVSYGVTKRADERRITPLAIIKDGDKVRFAALAKAASAITMDYSSRFLARSIKMIPTIRKNAEVFSKAIADTLGDQGSGDQLGALLAGAYSLASDSVISNENAEAWISKQDWSDQQAEIGETDEMKCLAHIQESIIKFGSREVSIAELIDACREADGRIDSELARQALGLYGIRPDEDMLIIASNHTGVGRLLKGSPWATNWARTLKRIPGAVVTNGGIKFGATRNRGVKIPYAEKPKQETMDVSFA